MTSVMTDVKRKIINVTNDDETKARFNEHTRLSKTRKNWTGKKNPNVTKYYHSKIIDPKIIRTCPYCNRDYTGNSWYYYHGQQDCLPEYLVTRQEARKCYNKYYQGQWIPKEREENMKFIRSNPDHFVFGKKYTEAEQLLIVGDMENKTYKHDFGGELINSMLDMPCRIKGEKILSTVEHNEQEIVAMKASQKKNNKKKKHKNSRQQRYSFSKRLST